MNIGLIVHSHTGNTLSVAESLKNRLETQGFGVTLERVIATDENPGSTKPITLVSNPDVSKYDRLILAAPVRAFSLSPVMKTWLRQKPSFQDKSVLCFVTEHFPYPWMGGKRAIHQCTKLCNSQGAKILDTGVINWTSKNRAEQIEELVDRFVERVSKD